MAETACISVAEQMATDFKFYPQQLKTGDVSLKAGRMAIQRIKRYKQKEHSGSIGGRLHRDLIIWKKLIRRNTVVLAKIVQTLIPSKIFTISIVGQPKQIVMI